MAASVNKAILLGHLGRDPEVRTSQNGDKIVTLNLATSESWKDKTTGERKERTEWHRVVIFNQNIADIAERYLKKGSKVYLEGMLAPRKWTDKDGHERYTTEVVLKQFKGELALLDSQKGGPPPAGSPDDYGTGDSREPAASGNADQPPPFDDDIPF